MNGAHLHLVVTHLPVLGVGFATVLLGLGLLLRNRTVQLIALGVLIVAGLTAGAAYLSGEGAEEAVEGVVQGAEPYLERHEEAGLIGLVAAGIAAVLALVALAAGARRREVPRALALLTLVAGVAASGTLAWVANLGGQIAHAEIRGDQTARIRGAEEHENER